MSDFPRDNHNSGLTGRAFGGNGNHLGVSLCSLPCSMFVVEMQSRNNFKVLPWKGDADMTARMTTHANMVVVIVKDIDLVTQPDSTAVETAALHRLIHLDEQCLGGLS